MKRLPNAVTTKIVEGENRFIRLIDCLDCLKPDNNFSQRLRNLNRDRNKFVHKILSGFQSPRILTKSLKEFCKEASDLSVKMIDFDKGLIPQRLSELI